MSSSLELAVRGRRIRFDENGLACLNDLWSAAGFTKNRRPHDWMRLPTTMRLIEAVIKRITGKSRNWSKTDLRTASYTKLGSSGGTFADVRIALAYAEFLNTELALEVREVFLRYKAADPTLADEILQNASPEANEWAATRAMGRSERKKYTDILKNHGVTGVGYGECTNAVYLALFNAKAKQLREKKMVPQKINLRDAMDSDELVYVMASESLAKERIQEEQAKGNAECRDATSRSASFIRQAIEADRADRRKRRLV